MEDFRYAFRYVVSSRNVIGATGIIVICPSMNVNKRGTSSGKVVGAVYGCRLTGIIVLLSSVNVNNLGTSSNNQLSSCNLQYKH